MAEGDSDGNPTPSPAAVPPTPRQLRLQAEARAKGGLTQRGIAAFQKLSASQQAEAIRNQLRALGVDVTPKVVTSRVVQGKARIDTTKEGFQIVTDLGTGEVKVFRSRDERLRSTFQEGGEFFTEAERIRGQALATGQPVGITQETIEQFRRKFGEREGTRRALQAGISQADIVKAERLPMTPTQIIRPDRVVESRIVAGQVSRPRQETETGRFVEFLAEGQTAPTAEQRLLLSSDPRERTPQELVNRFGFIRGNILALDQERQRIREIREARKLPVVLADRPETKLTDIDAITGTAAAAGQVLLAPAFLVQEAIKKPEQAIKGISNFLQEVTPVPFGRSPVPFVPAGIATGEVQREIGKIAREEPEFAAGVAVATAIQAPLLVKSFRITKRIVTSGISRLDPLFARIRESSLGVKSIKGVKGETGIIDIEIVPPGSKGIIKKVSPGEVIEEFESRIPFKETPKFPALTERQKKIIAAAQETDSAVGGSLAQKTLVKGGRPFTSKSDIDIVTTDLPAVQAAIEKRVPSLKFERKTITDSPLGEFEIIRGIDKRTGRVVVDIDPVQFAEEGLASRFGTVDVKGVKVLDVRSRLAAKAIQFGRGKRPEKVITDIETLTQEMGLRGQAVRGGFGFTFEEQAQFVGQTGPIASGQRGLFGIFRRTVEIDKPITQPKPGSLEQSLFGSPFDIETRRPQLRISRLGVVGEEASLFDVLSGKATASGRPQALIFEQAKISDVPKNLQAVFRKAAKGDKAAQVEFLRKFRQLQLEKTGEFKPFGFPGSEAEVTLAKGEIVARGKRIASTVVEGQRVNIFSPKIKKAKPRTRELLEKETLTAKESEELVTRLRKETKLDVRASIEGEKAFPTSKVATATFQATTSVPRVQASRTIGLVADGSITPAISKGVGSTQSFLQSLEPTLATSGPPSEAPSIPPSITPSITPSIGPSVSPSLAPSRPVSQPPPSRPPLVPPSQVPPSQPPIISPSLPPSRPPRQALGTLKDFIKERKRQAYDAYIKRKRAKKGKTFLDRGFEQLNTQGLTKEAALGLAGGTADEFTNRTILIRKSIKKLVMRRDLEAKWAMIREKFRMSKKNQNMFVEKRQFAIDSRGEVLGIPYEGQKARKRKKALGGFI